MIKNPFKLIASLFLCFAVAGIGSLVTTPSINTWYETLNKPAFNPPNWIFAPVWTLLFFCMGVSFYLIWKRGTQKKKVQKAIVLFLLQLCLNFFWSLLFFGLHSPLFAFIDIILLWIAIFLTIRSFWQVSKPAAYLLLPYLAWVSFAAILNLSIVVLNR